MNYFVTQNGTGEVSKLIFPFHYSLFTNYLTVFFRFALRELMYSRDIIRMKQKHEKFSMRMDGFILAILDRGTR